MIDAMKQALEALDYAAENIYSKLDDDIIGVAKVSLRQAIEQAEKQEPVRWFQQFGDSSPRKEWVGLTDDEIHKIVDACTPDEAEQEELNDFARAVRFAEAKLKGKNGGN
jgi:hypothetical protein